MKGSWASMYAVICSEWPCDADVYEAYYLWIKDSEMICYVFIEYVKIDAANVAKIRAKDNNSYPVNICCIRF